jgi:carboxyl-terminal processing protease
MRSRGLLIFGGTILVLILIMGAFSAGLFVGGAFSPKSEAALAESLPAFVSQLTTPGANSAAGEAATPQEMENLFKPFWQAWDIVHAQYVDQPVNDELMMRGAIQGMMDSLGDQHTSYMDPEQFRQANIPLQGEYEGIGAWVDTTQDYLTIVSPMPDSPAEKAGLKPGDQIIAIDGEDMTGIDGNLAIRKVLGPAGTNVTLTVKREKVQDPFDVTVERAKISVPSVESRKLDNNIAYVRLFTFGENSNQELRDALKEQLAQNPNGLILDLRNNGGGELKTAIEVASEFIDKGIVMYEEYGDGRRDEYQAIEGGLATKIPMVVLINEGSASASEIVAGAIQDVGRGKLVGTTSFGKGSVQNWIPLVSDEGAVRVTIARWLTPNGRTIHEIGLEPDVKVEMTDEDITAGRDPQLDKAVELLSQFQ